MKQHRADCRTIQQAVATGCELIPAQLAHIEHCPQCSALHHRVHKLDVLVTQATAVTVPAGFSERLMARIAREPHSPDVSITPVSDRFRAAFTQSRLLRNIAIVLGMVLGIGQLVQLILGIFFVSMMSAM